MDAEAEREEVKGEGGGGGPTRWDWEWWAAGSGAQLAWGISTCLRGYSGSVQLMPAKASAVAALFVGSGAAASVAALRASGIKTVEDAVGVGINLRNRLGIPHPNRRPPQEESG